MRARLLSLVGPATAPPLSLGLVAAALLIATESLGVYLLKQMDPGNVFGVIFLLGALAVATVWGFRLGVVTSLASAVVYVYFHRMVTGRSFTSQRWCSAPAAPPESTTRMVRVPPPRVCVSWASGRGWEPLSSLRGACGVPPWSPRRGPNPCRRTPRRGLPNSRTWLPPPSPTPRTAPNSPPGLTGLMDRVEALGGHMHISSQVGNGTAISVEIPFELRMTERWLSGR
jgi:hypothetical protein